MSQNERGFASLISMLIVCAIILVLAMALVPNFIRTAQVSRARGAADWLAALAQAETVSASVYGQYAAPANLMGIFQPLYPAPIHY